MKLFIVYENGERLEITNRLYWFEEYFVRNYADLKECGCVLEFELNGVVVWSTKDSELEEQASDPVKCSVCENEASMAVAKWINPTDKDLPLEECQQVTTHYCEDHRPDKVEFAANGN